MMDQYRQEMEQIHAPKDLIDKTKMAIKREEELLKEKKQKRNMMTFFVPAVVGAAAALMVAVLILQSFRGRIAFGQEAEMNQNAVLLEQLELTPEKITPGITKDEKEFQFYMIQDFPEEFLSDISEEETVKGIPVHFLKDDETGFYKAVFQWDSEKYLAISRTVNKELLEQAIISFLGSFKETAD